jgi:hypothetical protein
MIPTPSRLPETRRLTDILPAGREGGLEFARIVDLLLFHEARREARTLNLFSDRAGDYGGMDSFADSGLRVISRVGYQYKFYPSPISNEHRSEIKAAIIKAQEAQQGKKQRRRLAKLVVVTPDDLTESGRREGGGDVTWFDGLSTELGCKFVLEHWGHRKLQALFLDTPALCLFYYPELVPEGATRRRSIDETRQRYDRNMQHLYGRIEFVGMSVYKPEATRGADGAHLNPRGDGPGAGRRPQRGRTPREPAGAAAPAGRSARHPGRPRLREIHTAQVPVPGRPLGAASGPLRCPA